MRGDHSSMYSVALNHPGTSPHARGPLLQGVHDLNVVGNIPACAGTTAVIGYNAELDKEHPRMRGDHEMPQLDKIRRTGTSPHARGPLYALQSRGRARGNIPACAGTTRRFKSL